MAGRGDSPFGCVDYVRRGIVNVVALTDLQKQNPSTLQRCWGFCFGMVAGAHNHLYRTRIVLPQSATHEDLLRVGTSGQMSTAFRSRGATSDEAGALAGDLRSGFG